MMTTAPLFETMTLAHGPAWKNRFMLAPLTNTQSHPDGTLSDEEYHWLTMRATGGFGLVMTAAAHVQAVGQGFPGQIGAFDDKHIAGLTRLAAGLKAKGAVSSLQLHHAGDRSPADLVGVPVGPSDEADKGVRGLTLAEVEQLRDDFIAAAVRAKKAGFDGVEVHGAHGYIIAQFLSAEINKRDDKYGGSLENRARLLFEIVDGIRAATGTEFQIGLRLSPERFGLELDEMLTVTKRVFAEQVIDFFDLSAWDVNKEPSDEAFAGQTLVSLFTALDRGEIRLGAAGKIMDAQTVVSVLEAGCDFVVIGRGAILRHDFPERVRRDAAYTSPPLPVPEAWLNAQGLSTAFVDYMRAWPNYVAKAGDDTSAYDGLEVKLEPDTVS
jgi:2,4-dienoyl-CoA reductase-like NADH-dependent reductase (Old Yellow Enzyme family)